MTRYVRHTWEDGREGITPMPPTEKDDATPSIKDVRYAVLPLEPGAWVTYDRLLCRIVNGVWYAKGDAIANAALCCKFGSLDDMSPSAEALGLLYPTQAQIKAMK